MAVAALPGWETCCVLEVEAAVVVVVPGWETCSVLEVEAAVVVPGWVPGCELQEAVAVGVARGTQLCIQSDKP